MEFLRKPLTVQEIKERMNENNYIKGNVLIELSEMIDNDFETFLDLISERLIGNSCLMDIGYKAIGVTNANEIIIEVVGDVSYILEREEEYEN